MNNKEKKELELYKILYKNSLRLISKLEDDLKIVRRNEAYNNKKREKIIKWFSGYMYELSCSDKGIPVRDIFKLFHEEYKRISMPIFSRVVNENFNVVRKKVRFGEITKNCFLIIK